MKCVKSLQVLNNKIDNIKLSCFDLDGTLIDSVPDLTLAINAMLNDFDLPPCHKSDVKNWVGDGIKKMVERALLFSAKNTTIEALEKAVSCFEKHYQTFLNCESGLYPQVAQTIKSLSLKGYKIALVTNKAEQFLPDLLQLYGIADYFDLLLGGDTLAKNKPDPMMVNFACDHFNVEKTETVMIGDSRNDILAGQNAGVISIALTYGYNYGTPVSQLNPDYIIDHFEQLLDLL